MRTAVGTRSPSRQNVGEAKQRQTDDHQASFAEYVGEGAERRLDDGKGECEGGGKTGGGGDADRKILGHMRQYRIERAGGQGSEKVASAMTLSAGGMPLDAVTA